MSISPDSVLHILEIKACPCYNCTKLVVVNPQALQCRGWVCGTALQYPTFSTVDELVKFYYEVCGGKRKV